MSDYSDCSDLFGWGALDFSFSTAETTTDPDPEPTPESPAESTKHLLEHVFGQSGVLDFSISKKQQAPIEPVPKLQKLPKLPIPPPAPLIRYKMPRDYSGQTGTANSWTGEYIPPKKNGVRARPAPLTGPPDKIEGLIKRHRACPLTVEKENDRLKAEMGRLYQHLDQLHRAIPMYKPRTTRESRIPHNGYELPYADWMEGVWEMYHLPPLSGIEITAKRAASAIIGTIDEKTTVLVTLYVMDENTALFLARRIARNVIRIGYVLLASISFFVKRFYLQFDTKEEETRDQELKRALYSQRRAFHYAFNDQFAVIVEAFDS
jgi:hypothetical protein